MADASLESRKQAAKTRRQRKNDRAWFKKKCVSCDTKYVQVCTGMYYYVLVCTYLSRQFPKHGMHSVVSSLGTAICCTVHGRVIPWYLNIIKQCQNMKNVKVSICSMYLYIPYLIMLFQHIPVCTSMYKYNMICTILYQHIPVCTSTYLYVQIWPFLSEVSGFQM